ncbi:MAG: hypothetical protein GTN95_11175, partial [Gammaproteobacteria bacterium]|nr:hypothetical protein [Gammaproteobacteria bacterium]
MSIALLLGVLPVSAQTHVGANDPLTEGWNLTSGDTGISAVAIAADPQFPGVAAWEVFEPSLRLRYEVTGPTTADSWTLRARL